MKESGSCGNFCLIFDLASSRAVRKGGAGLIRRALARVSPSPFWYEYESARIYTLRIVGGTFETCHSSAPLAFRNRHPPGQMVKI